MTNPYSELILLLRGGKNREGIFIGKTHGVGPDMRVKYMDASFDLALPLGVATADLVEGQECFFMLENGRAYVLGLYAPVEG